MNPVEIETLSTPELESPALIEGLPGIGLVGKLAADHLIEELDGEPVRRVYSEHFPPAVSVDDDGMASLATLTAYAVETPERDLLVLTGDTQAEDSIGQYRMADAVLDIAAEFGATELFTVGGSGMGEPVEDYAVVGAVADGNDDLKARLEAAGVQFQHEGAPGQIVGMSGLLLGLGARRGLPAASLLGTTIGFHADPKSSRVVLEALQDLLGFSVDLTELDRRAEEMEEAVDQIQERLQQQAQQMPQQQQSDENLRYFE